MKQGMVHQWKALELEISDFHDWTTTAETIASLGRQVFLYHMIPSKITFYT